jgi:hypothetical protein
MLFNFVPWLKENLHQIVNIIIFESVIEINILCINICLNKANKIFKISKTFQKTFSIDQYWYSNQQLNLS